MKEYKVTLLKVINGEATYPTIVVACEDVATEIWLNPTLGIVWDVVEN